MIPFPRDRIHTIDIGVLLRLRVNQSVDSPVGSVVKITDRGYLPKRTLNGKLLRSHAVSSCEELNGKKLTE